MNIISIYKIKFSAICISSFFLVSLFLLNCDSLESDWKKTVRQNTIAAYQKFIKDYPENEHCTEAHQKIEKIIWNEAKERNDIESYAEYLFRYPDGQYASQIEDTVEYNINKDILQNLEEKFLNKLNTLYEIKKIDSLINRFKNYEFVEHAIVKLEHSIIKEIKNQGVEDRFTIKEILPSGGSGSITLSNEESRIPDLQGAVDFLGNFAVVMQLEFPGDAITMSYDLPIPKVPFGAGSIHRFNDVVAYNPDDTHGWFFHSIGDKLNRLTFSVLDSIGYVYMRGKGRVIEFQFIKDGEKQYIKYGQSHEFLY